MTQTARKEFTGAYYISRIHTIESALSQIKDFTERAGGKMPMVLRKQLDTYARHTDKLKAKIHGWIVSIS